MKRFIKIISVVFCLVLTLLTTPSYAAGESIRTSDVSVMNGRLFEVAVGFNSSRVINAARFSLEYDSKSFEVRQPVCNLSKAKVRFTDKNGVTDIIFLCSGGVKCSEFPTLFTMKYKKISDGNSKITIKASDCVDDNLKSFSPPKSAVCNVRDGLDSGAEASGGKSGSVSSGKSSGSGDSDDDILETAGNAVFDDDPLSEYTYEGDDDPWYIRLIPVLLVVTMLLFFLILLYQNVQIKKHGKNREDEQNEDYLEKTESK